MPTFKCVRLYLGIQDEQGVENVVYSHVRVLEGRSRSAEVESGG